MKYVRTRMVILIWIAFGIFFTISCSLLDKTEAPTNLNTDSNSFDEQLTVLNEQIQSNPRDEEIRILKAEALYEYAISFSDPGDRKPLYQNLRVTANDSRSLPNASVKIDEILKKAWNTEQSISIRLLQEDRSDTYETHFHNIIAHLDNAITIIPDSLVTYSIKSTTLYRRGHLNEAINSLVTANRIANSSNPGIREKLAFLYLESGNNVEAISLYSGLSEEYPDREYYRNGLINALIVNKQHHDAVMILRDLTDEFPTRTNYRMSLATELFYIFTNKADQIISDPPSAGVIEGEINEALTILDEAISIFNSLDSQIPSNEENAFRFGTFYMNSSQKVHELSKLDMNSELSEDLLNRSNEYLETALPYWERLADMTSENIEYMNVLRNVYLELGMNEEADSIERVFNF